MIILQAFLRSFFATRLFYVHLSCEDVVNAHLRRTLHCKLCEKNETPTVCECAFV